MNPNWSSSRLLTLARALWSGTARPALVALMLFSPFTVKAADAPGAIVGAVSNAATRNTLEGAAVSVPSLRVNVLTDNAGRYTIPNVPPGTYDVTVTYIGLDSSRVKVVVSPGERAVRDFELTTGIYKLSSFKVTGEREGNAAMITEKKMPTT
jgi:uncharacterized membrane protein